MAASDDFNAAADFTPAADYRVRAVNDQTLVATNMSVYGSPCTVLTFDFMNRFVLVRSAAEKESGAGVITFDNFDRASLEWHYNKMRELGKNPRPPEHLLGKAASPAKPGGGLKL